MKDLKMLTDPIKLTAFDEVTLLITHYNRSSSLERLLNKFKDLNVKFKETIVSDDASDPIHFNHIKGLKDKFKFTLISSQVNKGLGNNLNKGGLAVHTPLTLYVQEDFVPLNSFITHFQDAIMFMNDEPDLDIVRFYAYHSYPYLKPYKNGFSRMDYKPWYINKNKIYVYSDHPHLRRNTFFERFGKYTEGIKSDKTEYEMCVSFIKNKGKGLFYNDYSGLFIQENSSDEPSTVSRTSWTQSDNVLVAVTRWIYRQFKYNYDIHLNSKFKKI